MSWNYLNGGENEQYFVITSLIYLYSVDKSKFMQQYYSDSA